MAKEQLRDDSSHYEVSLTAGQAFIAFVLLLSSLAAAFAFGVIIGKGQDDGASLIARAEPAVISEGNAPAETARIRELGVSDAPVPRIIEEEAPAESVEPEAKSAEAPGSTSSEQPAAAASPAPAQAVKPETPAKSGPWFAQILSTSDAKSAEALAARLIDNGYTSAYVQRNVADSGTVFRVRVRFPDETAARAAAAPLKAYSKGEVWVTSQ